MTSLYFFAYLFAVAAAHTAPIHVRAQRHQNVRRSSAAAAVTAANTTTLGADLVLAISNTNGDDSAPFQCGQTITQQCLVDEGCVAVADSTRHVFLYPALSVENVGDVDFVFDPETPPKSTDNTSTIWHYNTCRDAWVAASVSYELFVGANSTTTPALDAFGPIAGPISFASGKCGGSDKVQRVRVNCTLSFPVFTECQWLDRTRVPAGIYTLRVTLHTPMGSETSLLNNVATVTVEIDDGSALSCNSAAALSAALLLCFFCCLCVCCCACLFASIRRVSGGGGRKKSVGA